MLSQVADGVLVHQSEWCQSNAVVVQGGAGVLLIDPGIHAAEMGSLANDLADLGQTVAVGFSTHPHWDHLLWDARFGEAPRYGTALCAETIQSRLAAGIDLRRFGIPDDVSLDLLGLISGVPEGSTRITWDGPAVRIIEHRAHAPGHAALLIEDQRVLVAGDMLSDVFIPMLDLTGAAEPIEDYLAGLRLIETIADDTDLLIPGHGSAVGAEQGGANGIRARIKQDRAYVEALRDGRDPADPRIGTIVKPGWEFVSEVHERQVHQLAERRAHDAASG